MKKSLILFFCILVGAVFLIYTGQSQDSKKNKDEAIVQKEEVLTDEQLKEEIGQMIMIGFRGIAAVENSEIYKIIKDVKIGGVVLFDYDVPSSSFPRNIVSPEQTKKLISDIQSYSTIPLFVAVDAEGGNVNRLKQKYGFLPIGSAEKMGQDKTLQTTYKESVELAGELKSLGFNMNLAPVVDVDINPKNPIIGALGRSFSSNPNEVFENAEVFIKNHSAKNIITVEKHFPGQGSAIVDSHVGIADVTNTYKDEELVPYKKLNDAGLLNAVMTGHIINKNIDKNYPASMSSNFLQNILRGQVGFKGVIISDDMQMAAISNNYTIDDAIIMSINAGVDVISVLNNSPNGYDSKMAYKVSDMIFNAVKENKIKEERIVESYNRILDLKNKFKVIQTDEQKKDSVRSQNFELIGEPATLTFGKAVDMANLVAEKIAIRPAFLLSIFKEELKLEKFDMCYLTNFTTGEGVRVNDNKKLSRVMKPDRDIQDFLNITKELKKDPLKTPITCPMSFGWGGAMGPADFIPSTWMRYRDKIEKITGKPADPWNIQDAFWAAGLYLSDSGAKTRTKTGEWNAAMIYFSGSIDSPHTWYADGAMKISDEIQADIDIIGQ